MIGERIVMVINKPASSLTTDEILPLFFVRTVASPVMIAVAVMDMR